MKINNFMDFTVNQSHRMALAVDPKNLYNPPSSLQYPGVKEDSPARAESPPSTSSSHSDLSSPSFNRDSEFELNPKAVEGSQTTKSDNVSHFLGHFHQELFSKLPL